MTATITKIVTNGCFLTYLLRLSDGGFGRTYTGQSYRNFNLWKNLKIGDEVSGLKWKNQSKKIIDADHVAVK